MRTRNFAVLTAFVFAFALAGSLAWAEELKVDVPFDFSIAGNPLPAGQYVLQTEMPDANSVTLRAVKGGAHAFALAQTRLSDRGTPMVVFDKVDNTYYLSEVYTGGSDGFGIVGATGKHTHVKISPKK